MLNNTLIKHLTTLMHNIWHHSFLIFETTCFQRWKGPYLTFDNTFIQRLTTLLSNVWQHLYQTLDNTFTKRWTITLSAVWKYLKIIYIYFTQIFIMIIRQIMCGRSVVEFLERTLHKVINYCVLGHRCVRVVDFLLKLKFLHKSIFLFVYQ